MTVQTRDASGNETRSVFERITAYYEQTRFDYCAVWLNSSNLALHFGYYDEEIRSHAAALENANRVLAGLARIRSDDHVLDAGCGLGGSGCWLAQNVGAQVTGITSVAKQAEEARQIVERKGLSDRVHIECRNYVDTKFPERSFDVVWALESLCHAPDKPQFYRESMRLLRPGGRLVIADYVRTGRDNSEADETIVRDWLDGWAIPDVATRAEHVEYAKAAGFSDVELQDFTRLTKRSLRRLYRLARLAGPIDAALHMLGFRTATQHGNVVASRRQYEALERSLWFYGVLTATKT